MGFVSNALNTVGGWLGKPSGPPPMPDFYGMAGAQGNANLDAARATGHMSNPNFINPFGSRTVSWDGDNPTVTDRLSPAQQRLLNQQNQMGLNLGNIGVNSLGRVGDMMSTGFGFNGAPNVQGGPIQHNVAGAGEAARRAVENAMYQRATARLDPSFEQGEDGLRSRLVAQGLQPGTEAFDNEMQNFNMAKNDAYSSARNDAITAGGAEQSRQFGMNVSQGQFHNAAQQQDYNQDLSDRNRWVQEALMARQLPLTELNALRTGSMPQSPTYQNFSGSNVQAAPYFDAGLAQGGWNQNIYNQQMGNYQNNLSGLFQLGSAAAGRPSDRRLKWDIKRVGTLASGLPWYSFKYIWSNIVQFGVMADEVLQVFPEAVNMTGGYYTVDYGRIS